MALYKNLMLSHQSLFLIAQLSKAFAAKAYLFSQVHPHILQVPILKLLIFRQKSLFLALTTYNFLSLKPMSFPIR